MKCIVFTYCLTIFILVFSEGCNKPDEDSKPLGHHTTIYPSSPIVTTLGVKNITITTADCEGSARVFSGKPEITSRGICFGLSSSFYPNSANCTLEGTGTGSYTSTLKGLKAGTKYYFKAYATNSIVIEYGSTLSFTTLPEIPKVFTTFVLDFTSTTAIVGGDVQFEGLSNVFEKGVYWGLTSNPEISGNKLAIGSGSGSFSSALTALNPNTIYYVKAYAENSSGKAYGIQYSFNTGQNTSSQLLKDIDSNTYHCITIGTQVWMAENLKTTKFNDGTLIGNGSDALYTWQTANTARLCPVGWHVSTEEEWTVLTTFLGGIGIAGIKLKETGTAHWAYPNEGATNESGFTALPLNELKNSYGCWWIITSKDPINAWSQTIYANYSESWVFKNVQNKSESLAVRCVKDK